ncbi:hypothetical protein BH10ACI1_BH10ACI1_28600 [soil metagenome]
MEEENSIEIEDIDEIIKDETENIKNSAPPELSPEYERQNEASYKIAMAVVYSHVLPTMQKGATDRLERMMFGK